MHRILICTLGQSPAVITETVWSLARETPPWRPEVVHVVTTRDGAARIGGLLFSPAGPLAVIAGQRPPLVTIHVPRCRAGEEPDAARVSGRPGEAAALAGLAALAEDETALRDVATDPEALAMGAVIYRLVADAVRDPRTELHLSLAGGRKTMAAHALTAFTLLGRPQDRASHVLVDPPGAEFSGFLHPDQDGTIAFERRDPGGAGEQVTMPAADVRVTLVDVPAPLVRDLTDLAPKFEALDFAAVVGRLALARAFHRDPVVMIDATANAVRIGTIICALDTLEFALVAVLARARREAWPGAGPKGFGPDHRGWLSFRAIALGTSREGIPILDLLAQARDRAFQAAGRWSEPGPFARWRGLRQRALAVHPDLAAARSLQLELQDYLRPELRVLRGKLADRFGGVVQRAVLPPNVPSRPRGDTRFGTLVPETGLHDG